MSIEANRKLCLKQQTELRSLMMKPDQHARAIELFLNQHAMLHSSDMEQTTMWSFEDEVLQDMSTEQIRCIPQGREHSIAWILWHTTRCEDITMNLLVAGTPQILLTGRCLREMKSTIRHTGNAMDQAEMAAFSKAIDIEALRNYRIAVCRRTREIVRQLQPADLKRKVEASRMQQVWSEGAVVEDARGIADYWSKRNVAGLLLMPATRHHLTHWNEALELKRLIQ